MRKEDGKTFSCDKRDRPITCVFCSDLHLTLICCGLLQKRSVQRKVSQPEKRFRTKCLSRFSHKVCRLETF